MSRGRAAAVAFVVLGAVYVAWQGFGYESMGDYPNDYAPAMNALLAGHLGAFFAHLPTNGAGGSLVLRAPAELVGKLALGTQLAEFRFGALLCILVAGALGIALAGSMRRLGAPRSARGCVIAVCVLTPAVLDAILFGHPEEPLGAALCIGAVLLAGSGAGAPAGLLLGLAMINKPWGIFAVAPVLLAARQGRTRLLLGGAIVFGCWTLAALLAAPDRFGQIVIGASSSVVAHPVDLWWPLARLHVAAGVEPAYFPPHFVSAHARELAVLLMVPLSLPLIRRRERTVEDCLALLAMLFLIRCLLDPSNHVYYQVPLVLALVAWESRVRPYPVASLAALAGYFAVFHTISGTGSLAAQFFGYLAVTLPLAAMLLRGGIVLRRDRDRGRQPVPGLAALGT